MAESEAEDRTEAPSTLRRQQARERGDVARSPELTAAAALLAATAGLGALGGPLADGLLALVRRPWDDLATDPALAIGGVRAAALAVLGPMAGVGLIGAAGGLLAHQAQAGGIWTPARLAPDPARLWAVGSGGGLAARAGRGAWAVARSALVLAVATWAIRSRLDGLTLGDVATGDTATLARAWAEALRGLLLTLAGAGLAVGLVDYTLQRLRFEAALRTTADQAREDRKAMDGDPSLRGKRARLARAWRGDAPELLAGATLVVVGPGDLAVILGGGPPPRVARVRSAAAGSTGRNLVRSARKARVGVIRNDDLAARLARSASDPNGTIPGPVGADLARVWTAV